MKRFPVPMVVVLAFSMALFGLIACSSSSANGDGGNGNDDGNDNGDGIHDPDGSNPTDGDQVMGPGDLPICDEFEITAGAIPPNLLLVVDKSGSMDDRTSQGSNNTKLEDAQTALNMMIDEGEGEIRFGWMQFPNGSHCQPGVVTVDCADDSADSIRSRINSLYANGGTPTGDSLNNANDYDGLHDEERNNFVVLLTDGMPTCPAGEGHEVLQADILLALSAVEDLHASGIDTFVIGLGEDLNNTDPELLNDMAEAGGRPRAGDPKYYEANSLADLEAALQDIGGMVIGCNLSLDTIPEYPAWLWVFFCDIDGENCEAQPRDDDHVNGWDYDEDRNQINFFGPLCDQLRSGSVEHVEVLMGCEPPT